MTPPRITYTGTGREPLRSNPATKAATPQAPNRSPGTPAGGTEDLGTRTMTLAAKALKLTKGGPNRLPDGVQSFTDDAT